VLAGLAAGGSRRERLVAAMGAVDAHEVALRHRIEAGLSQLPRVTVRSRAARRTPTLLLTFDGTDAAAVSAELARLDINAPSGSFYAYEASRRLGLGEAGGLRIGLAPYNTEAEVDRLVAVLQAVT